MLSENVLKRLKLTAVDHEVGVTNPVRSDSRRCRELAYRDRQCGKGVVAMRQRAGYVVMPPPGFLAIGGSAGTGGVAAPGRRRPAWGLGRG